MAPTGSLLKAGQLVWRLVQAWLDEPKLAEAIRKQGKVKGETNPAVLYQGTQGVSRRWGRDSGRLRLRWCLGSQYCSAFPDPARSSQDPPVFEATVLGPRLVTSFQKPMENMLPLTRESCQFLSLS